VLREDIELDVETYHVRKLSRAGNPNEHHRVVKIDVEMRKATQRFPAELYWCARNPSLGRRRSLCSSRNRRTVWPRGTSSTSSWPKVVIFPWRVWPAGAASCVTQIVAEREISCEETDDYAAVFGADF